MSDLVECACVPVSVCEVRACVFVWLSVYERVCTRISTNNTWSKPLSAHNTYINPRTLITQVLPFSCE